MKKRRTIAIIHGSDSDLDQMLEGLEYLFAKVVAGLADVLWVDCTSQHRHTPLVEENLKAYHEAPVELCPDVLIIGAGWAAHLPGCSDAFLRYTLQDDQIVVYGVAFEDLKCPRHTQAAELSITEVPGTQVVFKGIGSAGFLQACIDAVKEDLPTIVLKDAPESHRRNLHLAINEAKKKRQERIVKEKMQ